MASSDEAREKVLEELKEKRSEEKIVYTTCSQNGCFDLCLLKAHVKDGVITSVETDDTIHKGFGREDAYVSPKELEEGLYQRRACTRGRGWRQDVYSPYRLKHPMKQTIERGARNGFERISWDEALDTVAQKYMQTREKYGPHSVWMDGFLGMSFDPWAPYLPGGGVAAWAIDSFEPHDFADTFTFGTDMNWWGYISTEWWGGAENSTFLNSKLIVLWGWDALMGYPENAYYLIQAKEKGIPIIAIEPRYTWTVEVLADQWIPIRPGTDIAMMLAVADVMFQEDSYNHEFVEKWVEPEGLKKWKDYVLGNEDGIEKTPEWAEEICGVPAETIKEFARLYARSNPTYMRYVWAAARQIYGENSARAYDYLLALGGNIGKLGTVGTGAGFNMRPHFPLPVPNWGNAMPEYDSLCLLQAEMWPEAVLLRKKVENGEMTVKDFNAKIGNKADNPMPNLHMIAYLNSNRNLGVSYFGSNRRFQALKEIDFFAYGHYSLRNSSSWYADLLLPYSHQFFEGGGGLYGIGPFFWGLSPGFGNAFIYSQKVVDSPGEARHPFWALKEIAKRMGIGDKVYARLKDVSWQDIDEAVNEISKEAYEIWANMPEVAEYNPPEWNEFLKKPIFRVPVPVEKAHIRFREELERGESPFDTPSGKIEFYSDYLASADLRNTNYRSKCFGEGDIPPMAKFRPQPETLLDAKSNKFPLHMLTPHSYYRQHTCQDSNPWFNDEYRTSIWLGVADAQARGIQDGDLVRVYNEAGEVVLPAYVTSRLTPGVVCLPFGRQYEPNKVKTELMPEGIDRRGSCNFLIPLDYKDSIRGSLLSNALVEIEKFSNDIEDLKGVE